MQLRLTFQVLGATISLYPFVPRGKKMVDQGSIKQKVYETIEQLPPGSFEELADFLDFLSFKYRNDDEGRNIVLGGMWKNIPFDVTEEDVRSLWQKVSLRP